MFLILPYPPSANRYWRTFRGHVTVSAEAKAYKLAVALIGKKSTLRPLDGFIGVALDVYRPRRSGDLDNRLKVTLDALRGIAFHDDSQVVEIRAVRHDDKGNPRVEIEIRSVTL